MAATWAVKRWEREENAIDFDSQANQASSSSRLLRAGKGAPGPSVTGSLTCPLSPKGFKDLIEESSPLVC